jgi:hypothetical protein
MTKKTFLSSSNTIIVGGIQENVSMFTMNKKKDEVRKRISTKGKCWQISTIVIYWAFFSVFVGE